MDHKKIGSFQRASIELQTQWGEYLKITNLDPRESQGEELPRSKGSQGKEPWTLEKLESQFTVTS